MKLIYSLLEIRNISYIVGLCLALIFNFSLISPAIAESERPFAFEVVKSISADQSQGNDLSQKGLYEVSPPLAVQQIRSRLADYHPQLSLESPEKEAVLVQGINEKWQLVLNVKDWPLVEDPELGLGPHLVVQVDDLEPLRISKAEGERIVIAMDGLGPGSHRLVAYLAYPWGEALKEPGASMQWRIHFFRRLPETQPDTAATWLTVSSPSDRSFVEPLLIDYLIWNAPLQGLKEGDEQWRLRVTVNDERFLIDSQEAIWLKGLSSDQSAVEFELVDRIGDPINALFTNKLRIVSKSQSEKPFWMSSRLSEQEVARLAGETQLLDSKKLSEGQLRNQTESLGSSSDKEKVDPSIADYELIFPIQLKQ